jgi:hypothetical protein
MPLLSSTTSARCIRARPLVRSGGETRTPACAQVRRPAPDGCDGTLIRFDRTCRTGVHGASAPGDLAPNPASLARRCRRARG